MVVTTWWGGATSIQWVGVRDAVEHPGMHRAGPPTKNDAALKVDSAEVDKPALDCESHVPFGHQFYLQPQQNEGPKEVLCKDLPGSWVGQYG